MLDTTLRRRLDPLLEQAARRLAGTGLKADGLTLAGFALGLAAVPAIAAGAFGPALLLILLNRLADGLDGPLARASGGASDRGGFLDILCDFLFYAAVVFAFALYDPARNGLAAAFLLASFIGTGSSFLAFAVMAAKRGTTTAELKGKSFAYLGGLTEGSETIAIFVAFCLFPDAFVWLACGFGVLCWITTASRFAAGWRSFTPS